jgi:hypothetical protein
MQKCLLTLSGSLLLALAATLPVQAQEKGGTIHVQINYMGSGTVDASHKIYVALWDSPDFAKPNSNTMPIAVESTDSKDGTVTFTNVQKSPAYVSAAYDPNGKWDAHSAPPTGSSLGMYSDAPPTPEPINVAGGKTAKVKITFDDKIKVM